MPSAIFEDLFVLELANNHLGSVARGLKIIEQYSKIVRFNNVKAAIKLQFRDVDHFISHADYALLIRAIVENNCIPMATPFDEASVALCEEFALPIIKIASSSINDWPLLEAIAATKRPVIVSTGGASVKDTDDIVAFFTKRNILLALNHCVSIYPSEDSELELNQIDYLKKRYPRQIIGFSTHEYHDFANSMLIAYAKGARLFERHIDIDLDNAPVSPYCALPEQIDVWFKSYKKAVEMCGAPGTQKRVSPKKETRYLEGMVRGIYAKRDLPKGYRLQHLTMNNDVYAAVPLQQGQISCRELMSGEVLLQDIKMHAPIMIDDIDSVYARNADLKDLIYQRGVPSLVK
jgi:sialic acid synthase SpsE